MKTLSRSQWIAVVAALVVDIWKIATRAKSDSAGERVLVACERAEDRLSRMGFTIDTMVGQSYNTNLRVQVLEHESGQEPLTISECLSPAIYYQDFLVREAEVITKGR